LFVFWSNSEADLGDVLQRIEMRPRMPPPSTHRDDLYGESKGQEFDRKYGLNEGAKGILHRFGSVDVEGSFKGESGSSAQGPVFFPTNTKFGHYRSLTNSSHSELRQALQKAEDFIFFTKTNYLPIFRDLDQDGDSHISMGELVARFKRDHILTAAEEKSLVEYLDPQKKGFINFTEFHTKVYRNVTNSKEIQNYSKCDTITKANEPKGHSVRLVNRAGPSKEFHEMIMSSLPSINGTRQRFSKPFRGKDGLVRRTRYSANPEFKDTVKEFLPEKDTSMYASVEERFDQSPGHRLVFQREDKGRRARSHEAKAEKKQSQDESYARARLISREAAQRRMDGKMSSKAKAAFIYEHVFFSSFLS
jgi:hypothetical protein